MDIFRWDKRLESGVELLDSQHKEIIEHANAFFIAFKCGSLHDRTKDCLEFLSHYILYHFQTEEAFLVQCNYPSYRDHQVKHNYLATQVKFHSVTIEDSNFSLESVSAFYIFIKEWIVFHILTEDIAFAVYYKDNNPNKNDKND